MIDKIAPYWKAVVGFITPGLVVIGSSLADSSEGGSRITTGEWITALIAMFSTSAAVYAARNRPKVEQ